MAIYQNASILGFCIFADWTSNRMLMDAVGKNGWPYSNYIHKSNDFHAIMDTVYQYLCPC